MAKKTAEEEKAIATQSVPMDLVPFDYGEDEGAGFENLTPKDRQIPFIKLLQGLSPEFAKGTVDGAKPGMFYNTVTQRLYKPDEGFIFLPALTQNVYAEWVPRNKGGGYKGRHPIDSPIVADAIERSTEFGKYLTKGEGNQLVETFYVYGVLCSEDGYAESMAILPFWSTKIKSYKGWMTRIDQFRPRRPDGSPTKPPMWSHLTRVRATMTSNKNGEFWIPKTSSADPRGMLESMVGPTDERYLLGKATHDFVKSGEMEKKVDFGASGGDEAPEADSTFQ